MEESAGSFSAMDLTRHLYRKFLSKIVQRDLSLPSNVEDFGPEVYFDSFGNSTEVLCWYLFYSSDMFIAEDRIGYFFGRCLGFWGATNCTCRLVGQTIRFRNVKEGVAVFNTHTHERLMLCAPGNKILSRFSGRIRTRLADNSEMIIDLPKVIVVDPYAPPSYAVFRIDNGAIVRVQLYGRGDNNGPKSLSRVIHPDDVEMLHNVNSRISTVMLLSLAMYLRMYMRTRWLIGLKCPNHDRYLKPEVK